MPDLLELMRQYLGPVVEQQMGQAQAQNENPFLMFPNRGFFANHPNFTNRLESGMLAAAQPIDSSTIGSSITSVAQNIMGLPEARQQLRLRRSLAPLQAMQPLMALENYGMQRRKFDQDVTEFKLDSRYKDQLINESVARTDQMGKPSYTREEIGNDGKVWSIDTRSGTKLDTGIVAPPHMWNPSVRGARSEGGTRQERRRNMLEQADVDEGLPQWDKRKRDRVLGLIIQEEARGASTGGAQGRLGMGVETPDDVNDRIRARENKVKEEIETLKTEAKEIQADPGYRARSLQTNPPAGFKEKQARLKTIKDTLTTKAQELADIPDTIRNEAQAGGAGKSGRGGLIQKGNIDLRKQPIVKNQDGSTSTVHSTSFNEDGVEVLVPRVTPDGRHLSEEEAYQEYRKTRRHLGKFDSAEAATAYSQQLSREYAAGKYAKTNPHPQGSAEWAIWNLQNKKR